MCGNGLRGMDIVRSPPIYLHTYAGSVGARGAMPGLSLLDIRRREMRAPKCNARRDVVVDPDGQKKSEASRRGRLSFRVSTIDQSTLSCK